MLIKNVNLALSLSLTLLKLVGFWPPESLKGNKTIIYYCYGFLWVWFILGIYIISQIVELYLVWGNLPLVTAVSFVLFTNMAQIIKIIYVLYYRKYIQDIIDEADEALRNADSEEAKDCNRETYVHQIIYATVTFVTLCGWATSAEKGKLPQRAWYPYDVTKSPSYELSYAYQASALYVVAFLNIAKDTLITCLMAQCRCRLQLLRLSLRTLCKGINVTEHLLTPEQEVIVQDRLRLCVVQHNKTLEAVKKLQYCFSIPVFAQFNVSLLIICVTAFQIVSVTDNPVRLISMGSYLLDMMLQVFLYCYQGNQLSEESTEIAGAAYECLWYVMSTSLRRSLLIVMTRSRRIAKFTALGLTTLSLSCFTAIIKTSYSMFTLLQQLETKD